MFSLTFNNINLGTQTLSFEKPKHVLRIFVIYKSRLKEIYSKLVWRKFLSFFFTKFDDLNVKVSMNSKTFVINKEFVRKKKIRITR
jgi:hypothetical protein